MPQGGAPPTQVRGQATGVLPAEALEARQRQTNSRIMAYNGNPRIYPAYGGEMPNPHLPGHDAQFFARNAGSAFDHNTPVNANASARGAVPADNDRGSSSRGMSQHDYSFNEQRQR